jgi:hypothetical protein
MILLSVSCSRENPRHVTPAQAASPPGPATAFHLVGIGKTVARAGRACVQTCSVDASPGFDRPAGR